jgi:hypothetical protein
MYLLFVLYSCTLKHIQPKNAKTQIWLFHFSFWPFYVFKNDVIYNELKNVQN